MLEWSTDKRKLGDLAEWPLNPRQVTEDEASRLRESLSEFGQVLPICIDPDDIIIDGHQRRKVWGMADEFGMDYEVDVRVASRRLSEEERKKLTVFLEKAKGGWDFDKLANHFEVDELLDWGFEQEELGLDMWGEDEDLEDPGAQVDKAEELREKWGVESGQLWQLGEHRVICGDCTDGEIKSDLPKFGVIFTDPPYGIDYRDVKGNFDKIEGDSSSPTRLISNALVDAQSVYLCCNWKSLPDMIGTVKGKEPKACIVWDKGSRIQNLDKYAKRHEFVLYYGEYGGVPTADDDLWEIKRETRKDHPTAKPVELITRALNNERGIVYDPFLGSGTTLIGAEKLGMVCYGVELDPKYVAVTLERWHEMTGEMPLQLDT